MVSDGGEAMMKLHIAARLGRIHASPPAIK